MLGGMVYRIYFREIAGRRVFYPFGRVGAGYLINSSLQRKAEIFLRTWLACLLATAAAQVALHATVGIENELTIFVGLYIGLALAYVLRMTAYARRLKITPLQLDAR
jgi:hypothetical protein